MADEKNKVELIISAVDNVTAPLRQINQRIEKSFAPLNSIKNKLAGFSDALGLKDLAKSGSNFTGAVGKVGSAVKGVSTKLLGLAGVAGLSGAALYAGFKGSIETLDQLDDLSVRIGFNVEQLQRWQYVAINTDSSIEDLNIGLTAFTRSMGQARAGTGRMRTFLEKANPAFLQQVMAAKSNEEAFEMMVRAIRKVEDPQKRLALSMAAFGSAGESFANMAAVDQSKWDSLMGDMKNLSVFTKDQTSAAGEMNDSMGRLQYTLGQMKSVIAVEFIPAIMSLTEGFTAFIRDNREQISRWASGLAKQLPSAIDDLRASFDRLMNSPIIRFLGWIFEKFGFINTIMTVLVAYIAASVIPAFIQLGMATFGLGSQLGLLAVRLAAIMGFDLMGLFSAIAKTAVGFLVPALGKAALFFKGLWIAATGPIGLVIAGVTAIAGLGYLLYQKWEPFRNLVDAIWSKIKSFGSGIANFLGFGQEQAASAATAPPVGAAQMGAQAAAASVQRQETAVRVEFDNMPKGTRVSQEGDANTFLDMSMGWAQATP